MAYLYNHDPNIQIMLNKFKQDADIIVEQSSSNLIKKAFQKRWLNFSLSIDPSISSDTMSIDISSIKEEIEKWIREMETYREKEEINYNQDEFKEAMPVKQKHLETLNDIDTVIYQLNGLKMDVDDVEEAFATTTAQYRSPIRQAMNDITMLSNEFSEIQGPLSGYNNVSVYLHGIEDDGEDFFDTAFQTSEVDDILVHEKRNGDIKYYLVEEVDGKKEYVEYSLEKLEREDAFTDKNGRLHYIYETDHKNEHRQDSSDKLAESLIDKGLLNDETKLDMFGHSYGGRRSLQFAIDYPEHVRSLTTIGTPYDKNKMASAANTVSKVRIGKDILSGTIIDKHPHQNSNYLDFNDSNARTDKNSNHSNAYTDMASVSMDERVEQLRAANPEMYKLIEDIDITAVAGRDVNTFYMTSTPMINSTITIPSIHDGAVNVNSQKGEVLGDLVDEQFDVHVEGEGIFGVPHSYQVKNPNFVELVEYVNTEQKE